MKAINYNLHKISFFDKNFLLFLDLKENAKGYKSGYIIYRLLNLLYDIKNKKLKGKICFKLDLLTAIKNNTNNVVIVNNCVKVLLNDNDLKTIDYLLRNNYFDTFIPKTKFYLVNLSTDISGNELDTDMSGNEVDTDMSGNEVDTDMSGNEVDTDISDNNVHREMSGVLIYRTIRKIFKIINSHKIIVSKITFRDKGKYVSKLTL